jgi:hypothetical protein
VKSKGSTYIKCEFCNNSEGAICATIDLIPICQTCHEVLLRHGLGKNEKQIESERQNWVKGQIFNAEKAFNETHAYGSLRSPSSRTKVELDNKSTQITWGLFLLGTIALWFSGNASLLTVAAVLIVAILIAREYKAGQSCKLANKIQVELEEDQEAIDEETRRRKEEFDQSNKRVAEQAESESAQLFSRYTEIMRHANKKGISLWEYFRYPLVSPPLAPGYPPDWEQRKTKVKERDGYRCQNCETTEYLQVHHKTPVVGGGTHHLFNLTTLCRSCHYKHHFGESNSKSVEQSKQAV